MTTKKTREDVEQLKAAWRHDPVWDLETELGFEEFELELKAYRIECTAEWNKAAAERARKRLYVDPAYPLIETGMNFDGGYNGNVTSSGGMTKREMFAGMAMQGQLAAESEETALSDIYQRTSDGNLVIHGGRTVVVKTAESRYAERAVKLADALIAALNPEVPE